MTSRLYSPGFFWTSMQTEISLTLPAPALLPCKFDPSRGGDFFPCSTPQISHKPFTSSDLFLKIKIAGWLWRDFVRALTFAFMRRSFLVFGFLLIYLFLWVAELIEMQEREYKRAEREIERDTLDLPSPSHCCGVSLSREWAECCGTFAPLTHNMNMDFHNVYEYKLHLLCHVGLI